MRWNPIVLAAALLLSCGKSEDKAKAKPAGARPAITDVIAEPTARLPMRLNRGTASIELPEGMVTNDKQDEWQRWSFDKADGSFGTIAVESRTNGLLDVGTIAGQRVQRYVTQLGDPQPPSVTKELPDGALMTFENSGLGSARTYVVRVKQGWTVECRASVHERTSTRFDAMKAWAERTCLSMTIDAVN